MSPRSIETPTFFESWRMYVTICMFFSCSQTESFSLFMQLHKDYSFLFDPFLSPIWNASVCVCVCEGVCVYEKARVTHERGPRLTLGVFDLFFVDVKQCRTPANTGWLELLILYEIRYGLMSKMRRTPISSLVFLSRLCCAGSRKLPKAYWLITVTIGLRGCSNPRRSRPIGLLLLGSRITCRILAWFLRSLSRNRFLSTYVCSAWGSRSAAGCVRDCSITTFTLSLVSSLALAP